MLGTIVVCIQELVQKEYGQRTWEKILKRMKLPVEYKFYGHWVIDDKQFHDLFEACLTELNLTNQQLCNAFGKAWLHYTSVKYFAFFGTKKNAKDFILDMDRTHQKIMEHIDNAAPPRFKYDLINENTVIMHYESKRNMVHLWLGILNAVGDYFGEEIKVQMLEKQSVKLIFLGKKNN